MASKQSLRFILTFPVHLYLLWHPPPSGLYPGPLDPDYYHIPVVGNPRPKNLRCYSSSKGVIASGVRLRETPDSAEAPASPTSPSLLGYFSQEPPYRI